MLLAATRCKEFREKFKDFSRGELVVCQTMLAKVSSKLADGLIS